MPNAPKRFSPHGTKPPPKPWERRRRGTSKERGYGKDWVRLRDSYFAEHPLCERCAAHHHITEAKEVNHKIPFDGTDDPLRLDWDNLESLCLSCHRKAEHERRKSGRK